MGDSGWVSVSHVGRDVWPSFVDDLGPVYRVYGFNSYRPSLYHYGSHNIVPVVCTRDEAELWKAAAATFFDGVHAARDDLPQPLLISVGWLARVLSRRTRARRRESRAAMRRFRERWQALNAGYEPVRVVITQRLAEARRRKDEARETLMRSQAESRRPVWGYVATGPHDPPTVYAYRHDVAPAAAPPAADVVARSTEPLQALQLGQAVVAVTGTDHPPIDWDPHARAATEAAAGRPFDDWWQAHGGAYRRREPESGGAGTTQGTSHHSSHGVGDFGGSGGFGGFGGHHG
jgi:hypothetical protein